MLNLLNVFSRLKRFRASFMSCIFTSVVFSARELLCISESEIGFGAAKIHAEGREQGCGYGGNICRHEKALAGNACSGYTFRYFLLCKLVFIIYSYIKR